jgi:thymidylate kinase
MAQIIEFFGAIGAGKTTLCSELSDLAASRGISLIKRKRIRERAVDQDNLGLTLRARVSLEVRTWLHRHYISLCKEVGDEEFERRARADIAMWLYSKQILSPTKLALFDHLVFQRFIGLCLRSDVHPELLVGKFLSSSPRSELFVFVDTPPEVAAARLFSRDAGIPGVLKTVEREKQLAAVVHTAATARLLAMEGSRRGFPVVRCNGMEPAPKNARQIMQHIHTGDKLSLVA